jgi:single-strand DNA-binding protein
MANLNRVILAGNLTRDPQLSYTPANTAVCKFGLAINRRWTDRQTNEQREDTTFVDCTAFARQGETINQYLTKGSPLLLEGRLQFSQWTGQDGQKRSKLEVVVETFQFIGAPRGGGERAPAVQPQSQAQPQPVSAPAYDGPPASAYGEADIPF